VIPSQHYLVQRKPAFTFIAAKKDSKMASAET
jgi:hypothetical protein